MPHVILFESANFRGRHKHVFQAEDNLNAPEDQDFNDVTSSIVVVEGVWRFFSDWKFENQTGKDLGPGVYPWVEAPGVDIQNDAVSSLRPV